MNEGLKGSILENVHSSRIGSGTFSRNPINRTVKLIKNVDIAIGLIV